MTDTPTTSRRRFLAGTGAVVGAGTLALSGVVPSPLTGVASALGANGTRNGNGKLIAVFLRGGIDGMSAVIPAGDPGYYANRPGIAVPESAALALDPMLGLHPALAPVYELWQDNRLAVIHAVGNPARSRSHFDAQDLLEQAVTARRSDARGWLARHLASSTGSTLHGGLFRGVAISNNVPGSLRGSGALSIPSLGSFGLGGLSGTVRTWDPSLRQAYSGTTAVETRGVAALDAVKAVQSISKPAANAGAFADAAALLGAGLGVEVVTIDTGGWDTHNAMGTHTQGDMFNLLSGLGRNLAALQADLDQRGLNEVTTVVMSEFGRRVQENASGGTDHGTANMMLVMGGAANGGVHGSWPGLGANQLDRGDLAITTDVRDVLWELTRDVLGNPAPAAVIPDHTPSPVGITA